MGSTGNKESNVPIYSGVIDTNAVLNKVGNLNNVWNFQRNSIDNGWRPSDDPLKTRIGELPGKFSSYYPFSQPKLPNFSEEFPDFMPDFPDEPPHYLFWRKNGPPAFSTPNFPTPPFNVQKSVAQPSVKTATNRVSTTSPATVAKPKRSV